MKKKIFQPPPTIGPDRIGMRTNQSQDNIMNKCISLSKKRKSIFQGINSGVLYIGERLIKSDVIDRLIQEASKNAYPLEQKVTQRIIGETEGLRWQSMSILYNFTELPCRCMGEKNFQSIQPTIKLLHFNRAKPWKCARENADWFQKLWWDEFDKARLS